MYRVTLSWVSKGVTILKVYRNVIKTLYVNVNMFGGCILYKKHIKHTLQEEQHKFRRWHSFSYLESYYCQRILCITQEVLVKYSIKWFQYGSDIHIPVTVFVFIIAQNLLLSYVLQSWTSWYNWTVELITHNFTNTYGGFLWQNVCLLRVTYSHVLKQNLTCCLHGKLRVNPWLRVNSWVCFCNEMFLLRWCWQLVHQSVLDMINLC